MNVKSENEFIRELLIKEAINSHLLEKVLAYQQSHQKSLLQSIIALDIIKEDDLLAQVANFLGIEHIKNINYASVDNKCLERLPAKIATRYTIIPLSISNKKIKIAVSDPFNMHTIDDIRTILNGLIEIAIAREKDIAQAIDTCYGIGAGTIDVLSAQEASVVVPVIPEYEKVFDIEGEASMSKFVNQILYDAQKERATDIHIEPFAHDIKIRYRIDGVLHDIKMPPDIKQYQSSLITRIKILSNLDIAEHRLPQDGRIKIATESGTLDLRVSIMPTPFGESINIRLLSATSLLQFNNLGFNEKNENNIKQYITKSHGIIFLTGPTGSGKTTTLYSCIQHIKKRDIKIITIEDPIEYQIEGITQIQVHPKINLTFSNGLRSMLRHDPDVIMVGEIRDEETAEIAIRAALTGHLVFSTLHTNDAAGAVTRLLDMGIESYLISSSLECIIAQRLIRILCNNCKKEMSIDKTELDRLELTMPHNGVMYTSAGCTHCDNTGYKGRTAIIEIMTVNEDIRHLINTQSSQIEIKNAARNYGMKTLREDGWRKVCNGITSLDEIIRVTQDDK
ncbi:MAG: Flp pilus assembly complex ATPase component TadA [Candidatus Omnitrophica bacterium]|nr:Flp pilus assembly complex ATPase component TadA [Candidatus Omnitrophota bacterium]